MSEKLIVLIDDEPSVLLALRLLLGALGFQVKDFSSSREAVRYLEDGMACDYILSDLRMPELDGLEVLRASKRARPELPFVLISGHATDEDVSQAEKLGVDGFLGKPFSPDQLQRVMQSLG